MNLITEALKGNPVIFFSGGIDSLVLLHQAKHLPVITFAQDWTKEQLEKLENLIAEWNLTLYMYPPNKRYFVPNGENLSLIDEYGFENQIIPVIRDLEDGQRCSLELDEQRYESFGLGWNTVLTGILKDDVHPVAGKMVEKAVTEINGITFIAPLFDWSKEDVLRYAKEHDLLKFVVEGTGDLKACSRCLTGKDKVFCPKENREIPVVKWPKEKMLKSFQQKFGFKGV